MASLVAIGEPFGGFDAVLRGEIEGRGVGVLAGVWWVERRGEVGAFGSPGRSLKAQVSLQTGRFVTRQ